MWSESITNITSTAWTLSEHSPRCHRDVATYWAQLFQICSPFFSFGYSCIAGPWLPSGGQQTLWFYLISPLTSLCPNFTHHVWTSLLETLSRRVTNLYRISNLCSLLSTVIPCANKYLYKKGHRLSGVLNELKMARAKTFNLGAFCIFAKHGLNPWGSFGVSPGVVKAFR